MPTFPTTGLENFPFENMKWLIGNWRLQNEMEVLDEHWMDIQSNNMVGMFRWVKDGAILVTELMQIHQVDRKILLQLRHFDKTFTPWEEKENPLSYILVQTGKNKAIFMKVKVDGEKPGGWFVYELVDRDQLLFTDYSHEGTTHLSLTFTRTE